MKFCDMIKNCNGIVNYRLNEMVGRLNFHAPMTTMAPWRLRLSVIGDYVSVWNEAEENWETSNNISTKCKALSVLLRNLE